MPKLNDYGYGQFTTCKLEHYRALLSGYLSLVKSIQNKHDGERWIDPEFHYIDMNAGPGVLNEMEPEVPRGTLGSPFIFLQLAEALKIVYRADFIEANEASFDCLSQHIPFLSGPINTHHQDHNQIIPNLITDYRKWSFGLVYHDPNNASGLSFDALKHIADLRPRYDLLINFPAALFKRQPEHYQDEILLSDYMDDLGKNLWLIKDLLPGDKHQWTFLLGTNYMKMSEAKRIGLVRLDKPAGKRIFEAVNYSKGQLKKRLQPTLPIQNI